VGIGGPIARTAIFLDRDGVINRAVVKEGKPYPPQLLAEVEILPGVAEAIRSLKTAGYLLVVVSNQPDVARGTQLQETVESMNRHLGLVLGIEHFRVCYHDDSDNCRCRKPKPGLLTDAAALLEIDLSRSVLVGDRWRDISAGNAAGCRTIWIDRGYRERQPEDYHFRAASLLDASQWILAHQKEIEREQT
jgi:D-glycero-D-manno-heptose 1,7-bisphosphate phosphatase